MIGYGSPLHSDDRLGWVVAERLEVALDPTIAEVVACSQLTLELSEPISRADGVIFIDANAESLPGQIAYTALNQPGKDSAAITRGAFTHHLTPQSLLDTAYRLYGIAPPGWLYSIGVANFNLGETLSPAVAEAIPEVVGQICERIRMSCTNSALSNNS